MQNYNFIALSPVKQHKVKEDGRAESKMEEENQLFQDPFLPVAKDQTKKNKV
jgi:hypothetical protein